MPSYINRTVELRLKNMYGAFPAILVTGPRQSGKSTVLQYVTNIRSH